MVIESKVPHSCLAGSKEPQPEGVSGERGEGEVRAGLGLALSAPAWASPGAVATSSLVLLIHRITGKVQRKQSALINSTRKNRN